MCEPAFYRAIEGYRRSAFRKPENSCAVIGGYGWRYRAIGGEVAEREGFERKGSLLFFASEENS